MDATVLVATALAVVGTSGGYVVGQLRGRARGLVDGLAQGVAEGRALGRAEGHAVGLEAGRQATLQRLTVKTERVSRKATVFPWRRATETVRHELWIDGVPTNLQSEHVVRDEVEVDEGAVRALLDAGVAALTGGAPAAALGMAGTVVEALATRAAAGSTDR